jgi:hypothetical protein
VSALRPDEDPLAPSFQAFLQKYLEDVTVSGQKLAQELDFRPRFDLESGWRDALGGVTAPRGSPDGL